MPYLHAGGVRTHYEVHGAGEPLLLLHGGLSSSVDWGAQAPALAEHYQVILADRRGHGRTADVDGPITYDNMAADTVAFIEALGVGPARLVGWSDGALVGLGVARSRPDLVRKLVLIGQYVNPAGARQWFLDLAAEMTPESFPALFRDQYLELTPDGPEHYEVIFAKLAHLWQTEPNLDLRDLAAVRVPTLVLAGDDDLVTPEHAAAIAAAIPGAQLAIIPGASHASPLEKPAIVNQVLLDFLADNQQPKFFTPDALTGRG